MMDLYRTIDYHAGASDFFTILPFSYYLFPFIRICILVFLHIHNFIDQIFTLIKFKYMIAINTNLNKIVADDNSITLLLVATQNL